MKRERLRVCVCVCEKERERGTNRLGRLCYKLISSNQTRERVDVVRRNTCQIFWLLACGKEQSRAKSDPPKKRKKKAKRMETTHTNNTQHAENNNKKKKKKCFAER